MVHLHALLYSNIFWPVCFSFFSCTPRAFLPSQAWALIFSMTPQPPVFPAVSYKVFPVNISPTFEPFFSLFPPQTQLVCLLVRCFCSFNVRNKHELFSLATHFGFFKPPLCSPGQDEKYFSGCGLIFSSTLYGSMPSWRKSAFKYVPYTLPAQHGTLIPDSTKP